jgi:hypothetical protein
MQYHSRKLRKCLEPPRYLTEQCFLFAERRSDVPECGRWNATFNTLLVVARRRERTMRSCQRCCQRAKHGDWSTRRFLIWPTSGVSCDEAPVTSPMQETHSHAISFTEFTARCSNGRNGWLRFDKRRRSSKKASCWFIFGRNKKPSESISLNEAAPSRGAGHSRRKSLVKLRE